MFLSSSRKNTKGCGFSVSAIQGCYVSSWLIGTQVTEKQETHNATRHIKCLHLSSSFNLILKPSLFQISHNIILPVTSSYFQLLPVTSNYFQLLPVTSSYFQLLHLTSCYFMLLPHMFSIGITVFSTSSSVLHHVFTPRCLSSGLPGAVRRRLAGFQEAVAEVVGAALVTDLQGVRMFEIAVGITYITDIPINHELINLVISVISYS